MPDEILTVRVVSKDGGDYICRCPHCGDIITTDATELDDVRGQQYQHRSRTRLGTSGCNGWLEISENARRVRELPEHVSDVALPGKEQPNG
jgi:hypothetical protein